tara:strand:+ start:15249 stop:15605 length:357 start_codon:yes stop_codon:yes gene_type:complete
MNTFFKILSLIFTILFLWAAFVQWNDPDPFFWYAVYGSAAIASMLFFLDKLNYKFAFILATLYFVGIFLSWPSEFEGVKIGNGEINNIEHARESLGLLINFLVVLMYALRIRNRKEKG